MTHNLIELAKHIDTNDLPQPGSLWKHYKGEIYVVMCTGIRESNEEFEVCYYSLKNPLKCPWVRPLNEWNETVVHANESVPRFSPVPQFTLANEISSIIT